MVGKGKGKGRGWVTKGTEGATHTQYFLEPPLDERAAECCCGTRLAALSLIAVDMGCECARTRLLPGHYIHDCGSHGMVKSKGKVFRYSLPSVGPGADPGVQAVSPQVT